MGDLGYKLPNLEGASERLKEALLRFHRAKGGDREEGGPNERGWVVLGSSWGLESTPQAVLERYALEGAQETAERLGLSLESLHPTLERASLGEIALVFVLGLVPKTLWRMAQEERS